jgi:hypothetical protein
MRARLQGLDEIAWDQTHPNNASGVELAGLIRDVAAGHMRHFKLRDALLHQGTRFGGAAEALPFLLELARADETPERAVLVELAAGIGAPVEEYLREFRFDRAGIAALTDEELWNGEDDNLDLLNGFAAMCALDGRNAWLVALPQVSELMEDPDMDVQLAALCALAREEAVPVEHEARLRRALDCGGELGWHAALALGCLAEHRALLRESVDKVEELLGHAVLVQRVAGACALAFAYSHDQLLADERVFDVLASTDEHFAELSRMRCRFEQPLMGMVARARARVVD